MTATFKRIIITAIALIAIAALACAAVLSGGCSANAESPIEGAKNGVMNTVIDISGVKARLNDELHEKASDMASQFGIPQSMVDNAVEALAIEDWKATSLPHDARETGTYAVNAEGVSALVTTYDDPSVVTIEAYGQAITMEVPASAQGYVPFVKYLSLVQ